MYTAGDGQQTQLVSHFSWLRDNMLNMVLQLLLFAWLEAKCLDTSCLHGLSACQDEYTVVQAGASKTANNKPKTKLACTA
jgi:hypothetical protein